MLNINNFFYKIEYNKIKKRFYHFAESSRIYLPYFAIQNEKYIKIDDNVTILNNARLQVYNYNSVSFDENIEPVIQIGKNCYIGYNFSILANIKNKVTICDNVLIASYVLITNLNHGINPELDTYYMDQELVSKDVYIGEGSWIGEKAVILPGVRIGKKCVIGASSVVNINIPDYCIAVGNPVRIIKTYSFTKHCWEKYEK